MSNPQIATMSRLVPPEIIIFDEASQIEIGDYFPLLLRYQVVLKKLVFIGDHKQRKEHCWILRDSSFID